MTNELNKDEQGIKLDEETIDSIFAILDTLNSRSLCPKCTRSMKFFCYWCYQVVGCQRSDVPYLKLPIKIDVIKHSKELEGKSTVAHAKIIAPDDVSIYSNLEIPKYENPNRLLLLFPGPDSKTLNEIPKDSFDKLLVVDGTWQQATSLTKFTEELKNIRKITIKPQKTLFWRYQNKSENHLATIEALYYFLKEYCEVYESNNSPDHRYDGRYDDLLWYYKYLYEFIQATYRNDKSKKPYTTRHRQGYIEYDE
ncbi:12937_t:CDS:2 [Funneliformis caledonium]|uniref:tRNA-uridine aminocarboxypropyltransferase 1 n=2 Tax=Funneliformis TaxID=1117308 RepID=A0A9N9FPK3_9GLOM|nr:8879_t:CDS:2 [Funneliformis mosseae]CAG8547448.1 12937_t:CDS:2 [Funneliformis caledonium]